MDVLGSLSFETNGDSAAPVAEVEAVRFDYPGLRALDDVTFSLPAGSITALVGPNGAGKTTLMRCLAALDTPFAGTVRICGIDSAEDPRAAHRCVGYLADEFGLYNGLSVAQHLAHFAAMHRIPAQERAAQVAQTAARLSLTERMGQSAGTLSRGWRQRLAIAIALLHQPRLLILDEPASGLDPEARAELAALLRRLRGEGMTIIVSSHILAELEDYSTHMLILREGRLVEHAPIGTAAAAAGVERGLRLQLRLAAGDARVAGVLGAQSGVSAIEISADGAGAAFTLDPVLAADAGAQAALLRALVTAGLAVTRLEDRRVGMQEAYLARIAAPPAATGAFARRDA